MLTILDNEENGATQNVKLYTHKRLTDFITVSQLKIAGWNLLCVALFHSLST